MKNILGSTVQRSEKSPVTHATPSVRQFKESTGG